MRTASKTCLYFVSFAVLAACQSAEFSDLSTFGDRASTVNDLSKTAYYKNDELLTAAKTQFKSKNYGKAYSYYKRAIEAFPKDPAVWLGYAASADMIGRRDNADRGYKMLSTMIPNRPEYLNNVGYSHLLRGNLVAARRYFLKAYEIDPANQTTANNLELLRNSGAFAKRS
ncbi:tetratricopeptide repeat protein [Roseibium sp.]|uniref:tetratricopeptide repeat protein n=1 Tax=Roseibium sp. TaxID=1936156 RepID=UPI003B5257F4